ncbi:hypothetical protein llg_01850 [Luteolibacter sp. LG18]|nr:hypothetical protein llg_01850 [Luteolibacter sp. LG18]
MALAQEIAGGDHALATEPILRSNSEAILENTPQVALGNAHYLTHPVNPVAGAAGDRCQGQWQGFSCAKHEDLAVAMNDLDITTFHGWGQGAGCEQDTALIPRKARLSNLQKVGNQGVPRLFSQGHLRISAHLPVIRPPPCDKAR